MCSISLLNHVGATQIFADSGLQFVAVCCHEGGGRVTSVLIEAFGAPGLR